MLWPRARSGVHQLKFKNNTGIRIRACTRTAAPMFSHSCVRDDDDDVLQAPLKVPQVPGPRSQVPSPGPRPQVPGPRPQVPGPRSQVPGLGSASGWVWSLGPGPGA